jgi:[protein-PII] uridylyltransferase
LMQFDMFHIYTVDEHTVRVMLKLESFLDEQTKTIHPLCHQIFAACTHKPLVYLAALLHDIAKGREGDHAENGAVDMYEFARLHGFDESQSKQMAWLVKEHLTMSITAQRRDIHDSNVVQTFAEIVENQTALSDLVCLSVADICATNETLWNDWKRTLLSQLFEFTTQQLAEQLDYKKEAENNQAEALEIMKLALTPPQHKRLATYWENGSESYFLRNKPTQLVWHALALLKQNQLPLVLVSNEYARGATEIFIHCEDQKQLFARIANTLSKKKISIHDAQIITSQNDLVFDSFIVTEQNGQALDEIRCEQIQQALQKELTEPQTKPFAVVKKPIKHQTFKRKTKVRFLVNSNQNQTAFELFTLDREGLLAQVSQIFNQLDLVLINAKITTIGERVEDFFVVSTQENQALSEEVKKTLKKIITTELDS